MNCEEKILRSKAQESRLDKVIHARLNRAPDPASNGSMAGISGRGEVLEQAFEITREQPV
jgi:hypothetical protein